MFGKDGDEAVSELIAAVMLISLVIIGMAMVATVFFSESGSVSVPQVDTLAGVSPSAGEFYLYNNGGDSLEKGTFRILVDTGSGFEDKTDDFDIPDYWSVGTAIVYDYSGTGVSPEDIRVNLVYTGQGTEALISSTPLSGFVNENIWGNVTDTGGAVTPVPTQQSTGISIDNKDDIETELEADGETTIWASTIGGFVADRVDMLVYNYDNLYVTGVYDVDDVSVMDKMESDDPGVWYLEDFDELYTAESSSIIDGRQVGQGWWRHWEYYATDVSFVVIGYNDTNSESYSDYFIFELQLPPYYGW